MKFRATIAVLLVCSSLAVSGCSLLNPHVTWDRPDPKDGTITLTMAIEYANDAKDAYKGAVGDQALLTNALAMALIPLGGAALGAGIHGVSAEPLAYLALSGATIYSAGTWLSSTPRQDIYIAGIFGITCAVEAVLPLQFSSGRLHNGLNDLNTQAGLAEQHAREVTRLIAEVEGIAQDKTAQTTSAAESVESARRIMEMAQSNYGDGISLSHLQGRAGQLLVAKIDDIDALVAKQLKTTQRDLQSLAAIIQGLGHTARTLTPLPAGAAQLLGARAEPGEIAVESEDLVTADERKKRLKELVDALNDALKAMNGAVGMLSAASTKVGAIVNSVTRSKPSDTLKKCGVEEVAIAFTLIPAGDITLRQGKDVRIVARGGSAPYKAYLTPQPADGVSVEPPIGLDSTVRVKATDKAPPNEYQLLIEDATLNVQSVKIIVVGTEEKAPPTDDRNKLLNLLNDMQANVNTEKININNNLPEVTACVIDKDLKIQIDLEPDPGTMVESTINAAKDQLIQIHKNKGGADGITPEHIVFGECG